MSNKFKFIQISEGDIDKQFSPIKNHLKENRGWEGCFFETYGVELGYILEQKNEHIWTMVDSDDGGLYLISGYALVNRINYIITNEAVPKDIDYIVKLDL